jgi:hypothetical protein
MCFLTAMLDHLCTCTEGKKISVADPGCLFRIPDPIFSISDPGSSIFNPKNCFQSLGKIIFDVHPGSQIRISFFLIPDADPGSRGRKSTRSGSATLIQVHAGGLR